MRKILKSTWVIQEKRRAGHRLRRLNPWNPLSYITCLVVLVLSILMFGFMGFRKELESGNPFKWKR